MADHVVVPDAEPVIVSRGESPAAASRPDRSPEDERWHLYEANPVPWWVAVMWLCFFAFGVIYLIRNLIE